MQISNQIELNRSSFLRILRPLENALQVSPRGQLIKEIENYSYKLPSMVRFPNFACRNYKVEYVKKEIIWYLKGDRFDLSICDHAKIWRDIVNDDGSLNSNYGQYIFGKMNQFDNVVKILSVDKDSRRASIMILNQEHLSSTTNDIPCTYAINFRIRNNFLNMSVTMRSQDAIFGFGNDCPTFSIIFEMMYNALKEYYPTLNQGFYFHHCDSFHIYERHFKMLDKILKGDEFTLIDCPKISGPEEVKFLRKLDFSKIPNHFKFTTWLSKVL